ncbi:MAG: TolC family protein [Bacteroidota bacterium]
MLWKKISTFCILILLLTTVGVSQQYMSLRQLVDRALEENYQLQIVRNQEQMAANNNTLGNAGFLPGINIRADQIWGIQNTEQQFFNGESRSGDNARSSRQDAVIELDWTIFDGFSMFAQRQKLIALQQLGEVDTRYFVEQTVSDLAVFYYQLVKEQQVLESLQKSLQISAFRLRLEEQTRSIGTGNALFYHQALIDYNADSILVNHREMIIRELQLQISRMINLPLDEVVTPDVSDFDLNGLEDQQSLLQKALESNSQMETARLEELIAESNLRIERAMRYPNISVFGNYAYSNQVNEVGFLESSTAYGGQFGIRVRFNLYSGGRQNTRIKNVLLEQENTQIAETDTRVLLETQLAMQRNRYEAFMQQVRMLQQSLDAANRSLDIAKQQLELGAISGFEFRQAQLTAIRVENQLAELMFTLKSIEIDVARITGQLMNIALS